MPALTKLRLLKMLARLFIAVALLAGAPVFADEATRAVQEELRKRNVFHGDVDGRQTPAFIEALREYQQRKGFTVTGVPDEDTLRSMGISAKPAIADLPDVPVLRSDRSRPSGGAPVAAAAVPLPPQPAPTNAPPPTADEMREWVARFLEANETPDVSDELAYYADQVQYFDHGTVDKEHIRRELLAYAQQWLDRQFSLTGRVKLSKEDDHTVVRCRIKFELANAAGTRKATGQADNILTLARRPDLSWEIVGHQEQRVRRTGGRRSSSSRKNSNARALTPLDRTLKKFFNPPKKKKSKRR